jgi:hypothetical protein
MVEIGTGIFGEIEHRNWGMDALEQGRNRKSKEAGVGGIGNQIKRNRLMDREWKPEKVGE